MGHVAVAALAIALLQSPLDDALSTLRSLADYGRDMQWRFHWPAVPGGERPDLDDSSWPLVRPEHRWEKPNSAAWYRLRIQVPERIGLAPVPGGPLILEVAVDDDGEIYVNGRLVQRFHWDQGRAVIFQDARPGMKALVAVKVINGPGRGRLLWARLRWQRLDAVAEKISALRDQLEMAQDLCRIDTRARRPADAAARRIDFAAVAADLRTFARSLDRCAAALDALRPIAKRYQLYLVGHAHIDMNWLWLWPETIEVCRKTWSDMLAKMQRYPGFKFSESQPAAYRAIEQHHPDVFAGILKAHRRGQWEITGATWVQGDTNMASGEALCRQFLTARLYFMEKFGSWTRTLWLPDNFGHAWTLPTLARDAGLRWFFAVRCMPSVPAFWWEGPDGSRLLAFHYGGYGWRIGRDAIRAPFRVFERQRVPIAMIVYGIGDHGGGPRDSDIQYALKVQKWPAAPEVKFARTDEFYPRLERYGRRLPVVAQELNFTFRGCYTTHSDMKRANRELENLLPTAEAASSAASIFTGRPYPRTELLEAWRNVCFNQFHDLLPGSAIHDSYKFCHELYSAARRAAHRELFGSLRALAYFADTSGPGQAVFVFNRLGWQREGLVYVRLPQAQAGKLVAVGPDGSRTPVQIIERRGREVGAVFWARVPACGWAVYHIVPGRAPAGDVKLRRRPGEIVLENAALRAVVDLETGGIKSLVDKRTGRELVPAGTRLGLPQILWEEPHGMSAWNIGPIAWTRTLSRTGEVRIVAQGPVVWAVEATYRYDRSSIRQRIWLAEASRQLNFELTVDWRQRGNRREGGPFLKIAFPLRLVRPRFFCEIPFGAIERGPDGEDVPAQKWVDVCEAGGGAAARPQPLDLSAYFNQDAVASLQNPTDGDFDYGGISYPEEIFAGARDGLIRRAGLVMRVPPLKKGARNAIVCRGQTIRLPKPVAGEIILFGASAPGGAGGQGALLLDDGSRQPMWIGFSDWCYGPSGGERIFLEAPYRLSRDGKTTPPVRIFARRILIPAGKRAVALRLPYERRLRIFGITIVPAAARAVRWGVALLNDCKYGHDFDGQTLRLSIVRASYDPDPEPDVGVHRVNYALRPHDGDWRAAMVYRAGYEFNNPLIGLAVESRRGKLPKQFSVLSAEPENAVLTCFKEAEDGRGFIVRLYEAAGVKATVRLRAGFDVARAELTNVTESERRGRLRVLRRRTVLVPLRAHAVASVRLWPAAK